MEPAAWGLVGVIVAACRFCNEAFNRTTFWSEGMTRMRSSRRSEPQSMWSARTIVTSGTRRSGPRR